MPPRVLLAVAGALSLAAAATDARAAVHKCTAEHGGIVYQDRPCATPPIEGPALSDAPLSVLPGPSRRTIQREPAARPPKAERTRKPDPPRLGDAAARRHLRIGMSEGEVLARVGPPDVTTGRGRRAARWTWMPAPADPDTVTAVLFDTGRVVEVERTVVKR